jgi:hypothetical protein
VYNTIWKVCVGHMHELNGMTSGVQLAAVAALCTVSASISLMLAGCV